MHTPFDLSHWQEETTRSSHENSEQNIREIACSYLRACHAAGLEVIAITDHNFAPRPDQSFIKWLREENKNIAKELNKTPLIIFPGFEVEADIGRGFHVLCLFPQETPLEIVDNRLTALDLSIDKRFEGTSPKQSRKQLDYILKIVQDDPNYAGIVIAAHPINVKGLFDNDRISEWLQKEEFKNPQLMCLEVPRPINEMSEGWQNLLINEEKCLQEWRRKRPIACIMSSDCSGLNDLKSNRIGSRYTWIKMSYPSIESLRQAFLDKDSRIRLCNKCPDEQYTYAKIKSISVKDATFLRRMEDISWSPNLNCLIGSRGTGKSTLIDYMRLTLDHLREDDLPKTLFREVESRAKSTLSEKACIEMIIETLGGKYKIVYRNIGSGVREITPLDGSNPDPKLDIRTLFPCRFLSQREIDRSIDPTDNTGLLRILDDFIKEELDRLQQLEIKIKDEIVQIDAYVPSLIAKQDRRNILETQRIELGKFMEMQEKVNAILPVWGKMQTERVFLDKLSEDCRNVVLECRETLDILQIKSFEIIPSMDSPNIIIITEIKSLVNSAVSELKARIEEAISSFERITFDDDSPIVTIRKEKWTPIFNIIEQDYNNAQKDVPEQTIGDLSPTQIPERLIELMNEIAGLDQALVEIEQINSRRKTALSDLHEVWRNQTEIREAKARDLMEHLRPKPGSKPYVEILVVHQGDIDKLISLLISQIPDKRRLSEADIRAIITAIKRKNCTELSVLDYFIQEVRKGKESELLNESLDRRQETILDVFEETKLKSLEIERIPDQVTYLVYRMDGTLAGPIDKVSAGQQGTAVLNLLLAAGEEPLIVDTPEEGLDNEGVYSELVPLFRREKENRQIIIVTHNANLPVNADAEGIIALGTDGFIAEDIFEDLIADGSTINFDKQHLEELIRWQDWEIKIRHYLGSSLISVGSQVSLYTNSY